MTYTFKKIGFCAILVFFNFPPLTSHGQKIHSNIGILLKAKFILGNQNQGLQLGAHTFFAAHWNNAAVEGSLGLNTGYQIKKYSVNAAGFSWGYDGFILMGYGRNSNLLVSSLVTDGPYVGVKNDDAFFYGLGLGVEKEHLPQPLNHFNQRLGKFILRLSTENESYHFLLKNDFRSGYTFLGEGTDFGMTGMVELGYSRIIDHHEILQFGIGTLLFTPDPDYGKTPTNPINSADGSKNVWFTEPPFANLFLGNLYAFGQYQKEFYHYGGHIGMNSEKYGAFAQNTLHDSFGLNPRFPWDVSARDRWYIQLHGGTNYGWSANE